MTNGEVSPRALGRDDLSKYANSVEVLENWLIYQLGGIMFRPGTKFIAQTKTVSIKSRLLKFQYSTEQAYVIEAGNLYFRYYTDGGQLMSGGNPVELTTPFATAYLDYIRYTQNFDTMYITTGQYQVQKHQRTSATVFTIADVSFKRGPFLDTNITSTTIQPSSATGSTTLTASSAIFQSGHVGSLWRVKSGVVKITGFNSTTEVTGTVQAEPDGTAGNLGTTSAVTDWAEGSWSGVRGYPKVCMFHDGRLWFGNTTYQPGGIWGSVPFQYENFDAGQGDDDNAINRELNADTAVIIRWFASSPKGLQAGTTGGIFNISSGAQGLPITPDNISAPRESRIGSADIQAVQIGNYSHYVTNDLERFMEAGYQFDVDSVDAIDTTILADHILNAVLPTTTPGRFDHLTGGAFAMDAQQSPNDRIWIVRNDGQIAVLTRNVRQQVMGWSRIVGGQTVACDGKSGIGAFEDIAILQQEGGPDVIYVQCNRIINGTTQRFIEYFAPEKFKYDWDSINLDCSLTLDEPVSISEIYILEDGVLIYAPSHGFSDGDMVQIDNVVGTHQLNGNRYTVAEAQTDYFKLQEVS